MHNQQSMLSIDEVLKILINSAKTSDNTQLLGLDDALNKILAADVCADIAVLSFDNSAIYGYAIHLKKQQINAIGGLVFEITDRITAGNTGSELLAGCAARLFTGAATPKGANTVVMQEECELIGINHSHDESLSE